MSLNKILNIALLIFLALVVAGFAYFYAGPVVAGTEGTKFEEPVITNTLLNVGFILVFLAGALTIIASLFSIFMKKKSVINMLISIAVLAVVYFISRGMAGTESIELANKDVIDDAGLLKIVGTGLYMTYILFFGAIGMILYTWIAKMFK